MDINKRNRNLIPLNEENQDRIERAVRHKYKFFKSRN